MMPNWAAFAPHLNIHTCKLYNELAPVVVKELFGPEGLDLLKKMLLYDPALRITAAQAVQHDYFLPLRA